MKKLNLGFLTVHGDTENHSQMMNGVFEAAGKYNANVIRFATKIFDEDMNKYNEELNNLYKIIEQQDLDGLIFLGWMQGLVGRFFDDFLDRFVSLPKVSIGTGYDNIPNVFADAEKCINSLMDHLINTHKYKKIVLVPPCVPDIRNDYFCEIMKKNDLYNEELILSYKDMEETEFDKRMERVLSILFDVRKVEVEAIIVMYDTDARFLIKELKSRGINVPGDLAIVSFEDTEFSNYSLPPLTSISYPWWEVGYAGCVKLIDLLNNKPIEHYTSVYSKLIIRKSCGCSFDRGKFSRINSMIISDSHTDTKVLKHLKELTEQINKAFPYTHLNMEKLIKALCKDFEEETEDEFLAELDCQIQDKVNKYPYLDTVDEIEHTMYYLRGLVIPYIFDDKKTLIVFENILLKVQLLIKEKAVSIIGFNQVQIKRIDQNLHRVGQILIATFNVKELLNALEYNLLLLEIPSCYIFLFDKGKMDKCRMVFKYVDYKRVSIETKAFTSLSISDKIVGKHKKLLCQLLYVNNDYLGFILFEPYLTDERIYSSLSLHISSALKGALLLEDLKKEIALRKEKEYQLMYIADHDSLTGLFNRRFFYQTINYIIEKSKNNVNDNFSFYLLFIDIDGFKNVNDSFGHDIGDRLLIEITRRLKAILYNSSYKIPKELLGVEDNILKDAIFRLGGDEFTAIVWGITIEEMNVLVKQIIELIRSPYYINDYKVSVTSSIGISIYPNDANSTELIIKYADRAMYKAKKEKDMYYYYNE